ncbi:MAG: nickel pincer cofactor biosynthesis protein LarC [Chloroflexota bacterium]
MADHDEREDSRLAILDPVGGASGDMMLAALLDAGASAHAVMDAWRIVAPGTRVRLETHDVQRGHLRGSQVFFRYDPPSGGPTPSVGHVRGRHVLERIEGAALPPRVGKLAIAVFERLLLAEAAVHGTTPENVALHQLGELDTILDVVGVAAGLIDLDIGRILVPPLPVGMGGLTGTGEHLLPLPAPATLELLKGFVLRPLSVQSEMITPTAAAVIAAFGTPYADPIDFVLEAVGVGAGARDPSDRPNVLRLLVGRGVALAPVTSPTRFRRLAVVESNIDDLTPELLAGAADGLRAVGALDVWITPIVMKKGRPGYVLAALCPVELQEAVLDGFFDLTSTLGARVHEVARHELDRRIEAMLLPSGETVRVKIGERNGKILTISPEHDDVMTVARRTGRSARHVFAEANSAAQALMPSRTEDS